MTEKLEYAENERNAEPQDHLVLYVTDAGDMLLFPFLGNDEIQVIDKTTKKQKKLGYPKGFNRKYGGTLFWQPVVFGSKCYLLPHCGNGLLILDTQSYALTYVKWDIKRGTFGDRLSLFTKDVKPVSNSRDNIGVNIYRFIKNESC